MKIAFLMDPLEGVKAYKDTTYFIMLAAQERGHDVFYLNQNDLSCHHQKPMGFVEQVQVQANHQMPFVRSQPQKWYLEEMDVIFVRTDPPFDRRYFYATLLLDLLPENTRVVNEPSSLRDWNEKLSALIFPQHTPASLVSRNHDEIKTFMGQHGRIVVKPIDGHGGRGIFFLKPDDPNLDQILEASTSQQSHWIMAQAYVKEASAGDKRILLLDGDPLGAILRVHDEGKELNNLDQGGKAVAVELTAKDQQICADLKPFLVEKGLFFTGIDIIGSQLMEINVTSPTGLQELCRFHDRPYHHSIIERLEPSR